MPELRVQDIAGSWLLSLRWPERSRVAGPTEVLTTIEVDAAGDVELYLPARSPVIGSGRIALSTPPLLWEPPHLEVLLECDKGGPPITVDHPDPVIRAALRDRTGRGRTCAGVLDLSERVGWLELAFLGGSTLLVRLRLEVFPSKLSYQEDFEQMLQELGGRYAAQVVRLLSSTHLLRGIEQRPHRTLAERYLLFEAFIEPLLRAFARIERQPHTLLVPGIQSRPAERLRRSGTRTVKAIIRAGGDEERLPRQLPDAHRTPTTDTPANRFVRHALLGLTQLVGQLLQQRKAPWTEPTLRSKIQRHQASLRRCLAVDFLRDVSAKVEAPDLVVQRSPGYRDLLACYRKLLLAFSMLAADLRLDVSSLDRLYELWCAVRVEAELTSLLGEGDGHLLIPGRDNFREEERVVRFPGGTVLRAWPRYQGGEHKPDLAIEVQRPTPRHPEQPSRFLLLLDAKYRLEWTGGAKTKPTAVPVPDAINAMHRYRDAILREEGSPLREVYAGGILFPHPNEDEFESDSGSAWHRMRTIGVGAIPLVPSQGRLLRKWLAEVVYASPVRLRRLGPDYPFLPPARREGAVLLGQLKYGDGQLQQVRDERWYHLPTSVSSLPSHRPTHLAIVETEGVRFLWPIRGWEEVDGARIAADARFGEGKSGRRGRYWRLSLGQEEVLRPPIAASTWNRWEGRVVPLEVFDLADWTFLLHGDPETVPLLRLIHHLREHTKSELPRGWIVDEPILFGAQRVGRLWSFEDTFHWRVGGSEGTCSREDLEKRPIGTLYEPICRQIGRQFDRSRWQNHDLLTTRQDSGGCR